MINTTLGWAAYRDALRSKHKVGENLMTTN
jgi:hypothetical protein